MCSKLQFDAATCSPLADESQEMEQFRIEEMRKGTILFAQPPRIVSVHLKCLTSKWQ